MTGHTAGLESFSTDPLFSDYQFEYFVQRIDIDEPITGYNFIDMQTISISEDSEGRDDVVSNPETGLTELEQWVYDNRPEEEYGDDRVFYRVISCGYSPIIDEGSANHIVPLQAYYSIGGEEGEDINYIRNNLITEGFYRP